MDYFIKIDNREKDLIKIVESKESKTYNIVCENLDIGDIQIVDSETKDIIIMIERKTLSDLSASIKDGRYKEQKERMIHSLKKNIRKIVLIEGDDYSKFTLSLKTLESVIINTMIRDNIHIHLTKSIEETIEFIENIILNLSKYYTDLKDEIINNIYKEYDGEHNCKTGKKDNLTPQICFRNMLSQITGISTSIAQVIVDKYGTMELLIKQLKNDDGINEVSDIKYGTNQRRIGIKVSCKIYEYLTGIIYEQNTILSKPRKKPDEKKVTKKKIDKTEEIDKKYNDLQYKIQLFENVNVNKNENENENEIFNDMNDIKLKLNLKNKSLFC